MVRGRTRDALVRVEGEHATQQVEGQRVALGEQRAHVTRRLELQRVEVLARLVRADLTKQAGADAISEHCMRG
jgi:tRNA 2-selenouridine synthase SelU